MRIRRGLLFWGLLLIPLGAIPLFVRAGALDSNAFADAWRLWPLILVGIGLAILVGRGRAGLVATVVLALVVGLVGGSALASGNAWIGSITDCVATPTSMNHLTDGGILGSPASVQLELDCGEVNVSTQPGADWSLSAAYRGDAPTASDSAANLRIASPNQSGGHWHRWMLTLPAAATHDISVTANAASATLDLSGTTLASFTAQVNAGNLRINGSRASISRLAVSMNAGRARVTLGTGSTSGSLSTNVGAIELCVPTTSGLVLHVPEQLTFSHNLGQRGLVHAGDTWSRAGAAGQVVELSIQGSVGSFMLDPEGGC
jgi:hypothetical protein